jgi:hypothetical protein
MASLFQDPRTVQQGINQQQLQQASALGGQFGNAPAAGIGALVGQAARGLFGGAKDPRVEKATRLQAVQQRVGASLGPQGFSSNNPEALNSLASALAQEGFFDEAIQVQGLAVDQGLTSSETQKNKAIAANQLAESRRSGVKDSRTKLIKNIDALQQAQQANDPQRVELIRNQLKKDSTVGASLIDLLVSGGLQLGNVPPLGGVGAGGEVPGGNITPFGTLTK